MDYKFSQSIDFKPLIVFMNNIRNFRNYFGHKVSFVYILECIHLLPLVYISMTAKWPIIISRSLLFSKPR